MARNQIDEMEFRHWADEKWVEYSSESIPTAMPDDKMRLKFLANLLGDYKVILDGIPIYEGRHFPDAKKAYEGA